MYSQSNVVRFYNAHLQTFLHWSSVISLLSIKTLHIFVMQICDLI